MASALDMMREAVANTTAGVWGWLLGVTGLSGEGLLITGAGLVLATLLLTLLLRRRRVRAATAPQLLISRGEIDQAENSTLQHLTLKVSNLNAYPVQLLELAIKTDLMPTPLGVEATELLPPHQAIELEAALPHAVVGDGGVVFAYAQAPGRATVYRLQATFAWEPWNKRYKISPLGQSVRRARNLSSSHLDALRKRAWLERNPHLHRGPTPEASQLTDAPAEPEPRRESEKKPLLDFPKEF